LAIAVWLGFVVAGMRVWLDWSFFEMVLLLEFDRALFKENENLGFGKFKWRGKCFT